VWRDHLFDGVESILDRDDKCFPVGIVRKLGNFDDIICSHCFADVFLGTICSGCIEAAPPDKSSCYNSHDDVSDDIPDNVGRRRLGRKFGHGKNAINSLRVIIPISEKNG